MNEDPRGPIAEARRPGRGGRRIEFGRAFEMIEPMTQQERKPRPAVRSWLGSLLGWILIVLPTPAEGASREPDLPCSVKHLEERYFDLLEKASQAPEFEPKAPLRGKAGWLEMVQKRALSSSLGVSELVELHECAYRAGVRVSTLVQTLVNVAKKLSSRSSPQCLPSMVALQQNAYSSLLAAGNQQRAAEVLEVHDRLVRLLLRTQGEFDTHAWAARLLGRLALLQRQRQRLLPARQTLHRSVDLDPEEVALRVHLGLLEEKLGDYGAAERSFLRWVELEPEDPEARLRLSLTQGRLGKGEVSRWGLGELWQSEAPTWVRVVALQELAQALAREGKEDQALALLLEGLGEFPREAGIRIQLLGLRPSGLGLPRWLVEDLLRPEGLVPSEKRSFRLEYNQWSTSKMIPHLEAVVKDLEASRECLRRELPRQRGLDSAGWPQS